MLSGASDFETVSYTHLDVYKRQEQKRVDQLLRLTRNTDDCKAVKFDFNQDVYKRQP